MQYTLLIFLLISFFGTPVETVLRTSLVQQVVLALLAQFAVFVLGALLFGYYTLVSFAPLAFDTITQVAKAYLESQGCGTETTMDQPQPSLHQAAASTAVVLRAPTTMQRYYGPNPIEVAQVTPKLILDRYSVQDILAAYANAYYPIRHLSTIVVDISVGAEVLYTVRVGGETHSVLALENAHYIDTTRQLISNSTPTSSVVDSEDDEPTSVDLDVTLCEDSEGELMDLQEKTLLEIDPVLSHSPPVNVDGDAKHMSAPNDDADMSSSAKTVDLGKLPFVPGSRSRLLRAALAPIRAVKPSPAAKETSADFTEVSASSAPPSVAKTAKSITSKAAASLVQLTKKAKAGARKVASISVPVTPATSTSPVASMSPSSSATDDKPKKRRGGKRIPMSVRRQRQREKEAAAKTAGVTL